MAGGEDWAAGLPGSFEVGAFEQAVKLRTRFEWQSGEDGEDGGGLLIGFTGVGGGFADEFGEGWGVVLGEVEGERGATAVAVGVVKVAALEGDGADEGLDGDGAVVVDGFAWKRGGVVGEGDVSSRRTVSNPSMTRVLTDVCR